MRRLLRLTLSALALVSLLLTLVAVPAASAAPYCGIYWGSLPKTATGNPVSAPITNVRAGQHGCYDRLVVDVAGPLEAYSVRYVSTVSGISGLPVPLRGGARLQVSVWAPTYNVFTGSPVYRPANSAEIVPVNGYRTFRQVRYVDSFESVSTFGLGVRARLPFRVFRLDGPGAGSRLVIDVAHRW
jgi:hypothetical protein